MNCGLLGEKLSHSYSPQIHSMLADYSYKLFELPPEALDGFFAERDFHGINVTIPYKKTVIPYCSDLTPQAKRVGAVNTIVKQPDGSLLGHNSDYFGFYSMAKRTGMDFQGKKVLVLGSGGAANTVCAVLQDLGAIVVIVSRTGENNYENLHLHTDCAAIVNTTPVGMYPNNGASPLSLQQFPALKFVMDLIYNPAKTRLLLDAQQLGIAGYNGLWMLVAQAVESARLFSGKTISDSMIQAVYNRLKQQMENIILIGMPGCGKSTVGKLLAQKLNMEFADADTKIEDAAGCSISQIFQRYGEDHFRQLESQILARLGKGSATVIATGGGCVTRPENLTHLKQNGTVVWLTREISSLSTEGRPLSQNADLQEMYQKRKPMYEKFADFTVSNALSPETTAEAVIEEVFQ